MKRRCSANAAAAAAEFSPGSGEVFGGDRLGRIERQLEKTCTRVPPRSPRTSSTLPDEMDSFPLSFSSHYVQDQIDPNAIELERWIQTTDSFTNSKAELKKERARK